MIIVKLSGGLGNQMFQYAAGRALATKNKTNLKLDLSFLQQAANGAYTQRNYQLDVFKAEQAFASPSECTSLKNKRQTKLYRIIQRYLPFSFKKVHAVESGHGYHGAFKQYPADTYLDGYWQSDLYFKDLRKEILYDFTIKETMPLSVNATLKEIQRSQTIAVHVRRGDYISLEAAKTFHGNCTIQYYRKAIEKLTQLKGESKIVIFSDDMNWCKKNLNLNSNSLYIENNLPHWDLFLMSACNHHIIANSSFSWWAAWLNTSGSKVVIMPEYWFTGIKSKSIYLVPEGWITLE